ncbi:MAG: DUF5666 domain-containing protein [Terriglobales bacterium]
MPKRAISSPSIRPRLLVALAAALALVSAVGLAACGGNSSISSNTGGGGSTSTTQMVTTVGDTPMDNVLSAQVTISAVAAINSSGQQVALLATPRVVELSALGGTREPLTLNTVPSGTYTGVMVTATQARITYLSSSNQAVMATAELAGGGSSVSTTYNFPNPVSVQDTNGVDLRLDFNLSQSFDLTGTTVTFNPSITAACAGIDKDSADDLQVRAAGMVTAISSSSITLTMFDSGASITFAINSQTFFDDNETSSSIQVGAAVWVYGQIQSGGTYLAAEIGASDLGVKFGNEFNAGGEGRVLAVTDDGDGNLSSMQVVTFTNFAAGEIGRTVTVNVGSTTVYWLDHRAKMAGVAAFDATQVFPGQVVGYAGASTDNGLTVAAVGVRLGAQTLQGSLATAISGTSPSFSFGLQPDALSVFEQLSHALTVTVQTSSETVFGGSLSASGLTGVTATTPLGVRGFMAQQAGVDTQYAVRIGSPD